MAGIRDALRALFSPPPGVAPFGDPIGRVTFGGDVRSLSFEQVWGHDRDSRDTGNAAGVSVDTESALRSIAVQAAVRLLSNDIAALPVDAFRKVNDKERKELRPPDWVVEPSPLNPNDTFGDHITQTVVGVLTDGNAFTRCFPNVFRTEAIEAFDPAKVTIKTLNGAVTYDTPEGKLTPAEVIHIPWMKPPGKSRGLNPIEAAEEGLGIALASDEFVGSYFGNGAVLSGVIEFPAGVDADPTQVETMKKDFSRKHVGKRKSHAVGALTGGAKYQPFDYNNRDAQLLELRDQIVEDVARLFGIPPHMLGSQKPGAVGYASVEQRSIDYVTHAILPIVRRIEVGYSRILRGQQTYLRFNVNGLLRADAAGRAAYFDSMLQNKVYRREEVRALEDLPFDPEGVGYLETPNNNAAQEPANATD